MDRKDGVIRNARVAIQYTAENPPKNPPEILAKKLYKKFNKSDEISSLDTSPKLGRIFGRIFGSVLNRGPVVHVHRRAFAQLRADSTRVHLTFNSRFLIKRLDPVTLGDGRRRVLRDRSRGCR